MGAVMKKVKKYVKEKPHVVISVPTLLCCLAFVTNLFAALKDGIIDSTEMHQLLTTVDGFEAVMLGIIMLLLRDNKK